jgi:hypothetical protein
VLHMDCTFKLKDNEFPLVILGVTDGAQQLHVLSISIVSHCTTEVYQRVVQGLKDLVSKVLPQVTFVPAYVMTDACIKCKSKLSLAKKNFVRGSSQCVTSTSRRHVKIS